MAFFNCHNHTHYSNLRLLDCIIKPTDLIDKAIQLGLSGIAITDHESISAHMEVNQYVKKLREKNPDFNFTVALGNEIYLTDTRDNNQPYYHFILIAKDAIGHKGLRELSSKAWMNSYYDRGMERVPTLKSELTEVMSRYKGHIIGTTACMGGELSKLIIAYSVEMELGNQAEAKRILDKITNFINFCVDIFGPYDFYLECAPSTDKDQILVNQYLFDLSNKCHVQLVPATDSHYLTKETRFAHKAYLNSKGGDREVDSFYEFARLMDENEVRELLSLSFEKWVVESLLQNSEIMRNSIQWYSFERPQQIPVVEVPTRSAGFLGWGISSDYPTLDYINQRGNEQEQYWLDCCLTAMIEKHLNEEIYVPRLEIEADIIKFIGDRLGTCLFAYFNTFKHYIDLFWDCGSIVGPGRGSATGFLSNYLLGITQLDPIKWNLPYWRFLNKERAELPDIDIDLAPSKRPLIFQKIREERGELGLVQVATFGTEGSKSAVLTACRGYRYTDPKSGVEMYPDGIDVDIAQYIASLIPQHRGFLWSIKEVVYGNPAEDRQPILTFVREVENYPGLLDIIFAIEGIIKQRGCHASGVILYDADKIYDTAAVMKTPSGDLVTCYDLHHAEAAGDTKYDFLVTEVSDKIIKALTLIQEDEIIDPDMSLREMYNEYLHPEHIDTTDSTIWDALASGEVLDVFQFSGGVGLAIAKKLKPTDPLEMTAANAMMRLMSEKGKESQQDRYARIKEQGIKVFDDEMRMNHLPESMITAMHKHCDKYYGCCAIQEQMMEILMDSDIASFSLKEANDARKIVAKKQMSRIPELKQKVYDVMDKRLADYIWEVAVAPQLGYAFSMNHSLPYSFVGIQTIILATQFDSIYWNTACLIVNSGATDEELEGTTNYGKIAKAIGDIRSAGIEVSAVDINKSQYGFKPDMGEGKILYGLKGMLNVGDEVIQNIIDNRPYVSFEDFLTRVKANKQAVISLIKGGAFDKFGERKYIMAKYIWMTCNKKKRLTLQNMNGLIQHGMIPGCLTHQKTVFEFNRYLKDVCSYKTEANYFILDDRAYRYIDNNYLGVVSLEIYGSGYALNKKMWDKVYQAEMDAVREYLKGHQDEMLYQLNKEIFLEDWNKYASGNYSSWEMEVLCFYYHDHEMKDLNRKKYGISNFFELPEEPEIDYYVRNGTIPIYKLHRIAGTCIAKNKTKGTVSLLTPEGVVEVKFRNEYFAMFDKQISARGVDGIKHVVEKSWFNRGSMIVVTGIRRGDDFIPKKYSATPGHQLYHIDALMPNGTMTLRSERAQGESEDE